MLYCKSLVKFPDFCNEARCRQFSAKVSNSPNVITQPLQKVIFHQSLSHRLYISRIFSNVKFYFMLLEIHLTSSPNHSKNSWYQQWDIFLHRIIYSGIFSKVTFYHMLLTIHLTSSPNTSKSPKYRRLDIFLHTVICSRIF